VYQGDKANEGERNEDDALKDTQRAWFQALDVLQIERETHQGDTRQQACSIHLSCFQHRQSPPTNLPVAGTTIRIFGDSSTVRIVSFTV
jgi:hypothetical protein